VSSTEQHDSLSYCLQNGNPSVGTFIGFCCFESGGHLEVNLMASAKKEEKNIFKFKFEEKKAFFFLKIFFFGCRCFHRCFYVIVYEIVFH